MWWLISRRAAASRLRPPRPPQRRSYLRAGDVGRERHLTPRPLRHHQKMEDGAWSYRPPRARRATPGLAMRGSALSPWRGRHFGPASPRSEQSSSRPTALSSRLLADVGTSRAVRLGNWPTCTSRMPRSMPLRSSGAAGSGRTISFSRRLSLAACVTVLRSRRQSERLPSPPRFLRGTSMMRFWHVAGPAEESERVGPVISDVRGAFATLLHLVWLIEEGGADHHTVAAHDVAIPTCNELAGS